MHVCTCFLHLGDAVDSDTLFYVLLLPTGLKWCSPCVPGGPSPWPRRGSGRAGPWGGGNACIPPFKMLTMDVSTLHHEDAMRDGYWPKMLLFTLDELFYIYSQIKNQQRVNEKIVITYKILCLSMNRCTDWWHGLEKTSMPDVLALLNINDAHHLEHLSWAVYDGTLLVGPWPELPGDRPWCMVLAWLHKHIYRGCNDVAHCPLHVLGSWDCQEQIEVLQRGGDLAPCEAGRDEHPSPGGGPKTVRNTALRHQPGGGRDGYSHGSSTPHAFEVSPQSDHTPLYAFQVLSMSPNISTMPKVVSAVNVPSHARSSHSSEGTARASLDENDMWEDYFQTLHMPVHHVVQQEDDGHGDPAEGRQESSRRNPGQ